MNGGSARITPEAAEVRCSVAPGEPIPDDVLGAWCAGRNVTVWAIIEGSGLNEGPLMCCPGPAGLRFTEAMSTANVFAQVDLLPCCQGSLEAEGEEVACTRDTLDDPPARALDVLRTVAAHHGIEWPDDIGGPAT